MENKKKDLDKIDSALTKLADQCKADADAHVSAQKHFHAVSAGLHSNEDGEDASLNEQLISKLCRYIF